MKPFQNFNPEFNNQQKQIESVINFKESDKRTMILSGNVGTGKTHLSKELKKLYPKMKSRDLMTAGYIESCVFVKAKELYFMIYEDMFPGMDSMDLPYYLNDLYKKRCVIIDDLGTEPVDPKGYFKSSLQDFIERINGKLVITTNLDANQLEQKYGQKIFSRLCESVEWIPMVGKDYRRVT